MYRPLTYNLQTIFIYWRGYINNYIIKTVKCINILEALAEQYNLNNISCDGFIGTFKYVIESHSKFKDNYLNNRNIRSVRKYQLIKDYNMILSIVDKEHKRQLNNVVNKVTLARNRIIDIAINNKCKFIPSHANFVAIDCLKDSSYAKKVLENLIKKGIFVRMPYSYPQNRCIRVTVGLEDDINLFEEYFPIALAES